MKYWQKGLSLIQVILIIAVIAIILIVAIPRFIKLSTDERIAEVKGLLGAVREASDLAHEEAIAEKQTAKTGIINLQSKKINLIYGYPVATKGGIDVAVGKYAGFHFSTGIFTLQGGDKENVANCFVQYKEPTEANTSPIIIANTKGC